MENTQTKSTEQDVREELERLKKQIAEKEKRLEEAYVEKHMALEEGYDKKQRELEGEYKKKMQELEGKTRAFEEERRKIMDLRAKSADIIELNVGGKPFTTTRATLCAQPDTLLASMFSGRWEHSIPRDKNGAIFLDFNPDLFALLLDHLRTLQQQASTPVGKMPSPSLPPVSPEQKETWRGILGYLGFIKSINAVSYRFEETAENSKTHTFGEGGASFFTREDRAGIVRILPECDVTQGSAFSCTLKWSRPEDSEYVWVCGVWPGKGGDAHPPLKEGYYFNEWGSFRRTAFTPKPHGRVFSAEGNVVLTLDVLQRTLAIKTQEGEETRVDDIDTTHTQQYYFGVMCQSKGGMVEIVHVHE